MIEIIALGWFANQVGEMARSKGYRAGQYRLTAIMLWCIGEVCGLFFGLSLSLGDSAAAFLVIYLCALLGASCGAIIAYSIARGLKSGFAHA